MSIDCRGVKPQLSLSAGIVFTLLPARLVTGTSTYVHILLPDADLISMLNNLLRDVDLNFCLQLVVENNGESWEPGKRWVTDFISLLL